MKTVLDALQDPELLGSHFHPWSQWKRWAVVLKAVFGLPMTPVERPVFKALFGLSTPPTTRASEALILAGRGAGKTKVSAAIAVMMAVLFDWSHLKRKARVLLLATDREQAEEAMAFVSQYFEAPKLAALVQERTKRSITLTNGITIQIRTASPRGVRGPSVVAGHRGRVRLPAT